MQTTAAPSHPSNLELQALSVLWHEGPSTVGVIHDTLPDGRERAYTTVLSVMQSLERKGLVERARSGRAHVYKAAHGKEGIVRRATEEFILNAFGGRLEEAVLAILSAGSLTPEEKTNIERELQRHKTMAAKKSAKNAASKTARKASKKSARKTEKKVPAKKATGRKTVKKSAGKGAGKAAKNAPAKKAAVKKKAAGKVAKKGAKKVARSSGKAPGKAAKKVVAKKTVKKAVKKVVKKAPSRKVISKKVVSRKAAKKAAI